MVKTPKSKDKIRFTDCDMFGHLNNSRYLDYLINAREDHLKDFYNFDFNQYYRNDLAWVIGSHEIVYIKPALYNEIVIIQSSLINVDVDMLHVETVMMNEKENQIKAIMWSKLIPINLKTGRKVEHDNQFITWAKKIENTEIGQNNNIKSRITYLLSSTKHKLTSNQ